MFTFSRKNTIFPDSNKIQFTSRYINPSPISGYSFQKNTNKPSITNGPLRTPGRIPDTPSCKRNLQALMAEIQNMQNSFLGTFPVFRINAFSNYWKPMESCFVVVVSVLTSYLATNGKFYLPIILAALGIIHFVQLMYKTANDYEKVEIFHHNITKLKDVILKLANEYISIIGRCEILRNYVDELIVFSDNALNAFNLRKRPYQFEYDTQFLLRYIAFTSIAIALTCYLAWFPYLTGMVFTSFLVAWIPRFMSILFVSCFYHLIWYLYFTSGTEQRASINIRSMEVSTKLDDLLAEVTDIDNRI